MELGKYVGKFVKVDLSNGFYYSGRVTSADATSLEIVDKNNHLVTISINTISFIREVTP